MSTFKKISIGCGIPLLILGGIFYFLYTSLNGGFTFTKRDFPALAGPKNITLSCDYAGTPLTVEHTLYQSVYDHYKTEPTKKKTYYREDHKSFVFSYEEDTTIKEIMKKIADVGDSMGLSSDQKLDLTACFIQNIPYDQPKADKVLDPNNTYPIAETIPRYPYETLYDDAAICTGKTFIGALMLQELGYDLGILTFDKEQHMMLGVGVPADYTNFNTDYGGLELTNVGFKVGTVSEVSDSGGAVDKIEKIDTTSGIQEESSLALSTPSDIQVVQDGSIYKRIAERSSLNIKIDTLWDQITGMEVKVTEANSDLKTAEAKQIQAKRVYQNSGTQADYNKYMIEYNAYMAVYNSSSGVVNSYNTLVNQYNDTIEKYQIF